MENTQSLSIMRDLILGKRWVLSLLIILRAFSTSVIIVCILFLKFNNSFIFFYYSREIYVKTNTSIPHQNILYHRDRDRERERRSSFLILQCHLPPEIESMKKKGGRWWWYKLILLRYIPWYNHMLHSVCIQVLCSLCYFMLFYLCYPPSWTTLNLKQWHFLSLLIYIYIDMLKYYYKYFF